MRKLLLIVFMAVPFLPRSQALESLIFREKTYDFGDIMESIGNVDCEFVFTNNSGRPIKILSVSTSCGCTTPGWSQQPVPPGKTGFIKASFDPRGRPGYFNKSLTVITDLDPNPLVLQIRGQVVTVNANVANAFSVIVGRLHFKTKSFNVGTVFINREATQKQFEVMNAGTTPIRFVAVEKPPYVRVEAPPVLGPNEIGIIKVFYDGKARNKFGFASDNLVFVTDDAENERKSFSLYATLEEYYPTPTGADVLRAPQAVLREQSIDFGQYPIGASVERIITLVNKGKKELQIKALQGNCTCIFAESEQHNVRPGDSTNIKISFKPQNRGGTQQKAITLYTNDPRNPVQWINVQVFIEN